MRFSSRYFKEVELDGQRIILPNREGWKRLIFDPFIDDVHVATLQTLWGNLVFIQDYAEFRIGLVFRRFGTAKWFPYVFLMVAGAGWLRVHLEGVQCNSCSWFGVVANHLLREQYVDFPEWEAAWRRAQTLPPKPCPVCEATLPRPAVWIQPHIITP